MSILSGKLISKHGHYKRYPIVGLALMTIGILSMSTLSETTPYWRLSLFEILVGAGLGLSMQTIVIALQNAIDFKHMGVATSANTFFRSVGSTIGVAIFGTIYANRLAHYLPAMIAELGSRNPSAVAAATPDKLAQLRNNSEIIKTFSPELQQGVVHSFVLSFHDVFRAAAPVTAIGFVVALFLRETTLRSGASFQAAKEEAAGEAVA
jgi:MFS family permease